MKVKVDKGGFRPTRAHGTDGGLDLYAMEAAKILPHDSEVFRTGVHVEIPEGCCGLLVSKSGLNIARDVTSTGLIDEGYTGEILVKLNNHGGTPVIIGRGQKISQLVVIPVRYENVEIVDEIQGGDRGDSGFGSTGS